jgi:hypothetical protein
MGRMILRERVTIILILGIWNLFVQCSSQADEPELVCGPAPSPCYPGGYGALRTFVKQNLKYPRDRATVEGTVFIEFAVDEEGCLSEFLVIKGLTGSYDSSALEVAKKMPDWISAELDGKPTRSKMIIPIKFWLKNV